MISDMEEIKTIIRDLKHAGCCPRCILRHLDIKDPSVYQTTNSALEKIAELEDNTLSLPEIPLPKKERLSPCILCTGTLAELCNLSSVNQIIEKIKEEDFYFEDFVLSLTIPSCCQIREHLTQIYVKKKLAPSAKNNPVSYIPSIKEVWKWIVGPIIENEFNVSLNVLSSFEIAVSMEFDEDFDECKNSLKLLDNGTDTRKSKAKNSYCSRALIEKLLNSVSDDDMLIYFPWPPAVPTSPCFIQKIQCSQKSLFFAGRYNKYSRNLCQTPWLIDGEKLMATSIKEIICDFLIPHVKAREVKFSASGREDVDVRTLGKGRPFVLEFVNPHRIKFTQQEMMQFQNEINKTTTDIAVRDLQIVSRDDISNLKEGEEEKTKVYSALCVCKHPIDLEELQLLNSFKDLVIAQKTPIRVLHRRPFAVRERVIHEMTTEPVDKFHFKLHLKTQAGTYIKEFVHSDFGRTNPSLRTLINDEVDILELDVEAVDLDWPPEIDES